MERKLKALFLPTVQRKFSLNEIPKNSLATTTKKFRLKAHQSGFKLRIYLSSVFLYKVR